MKSLNLLLLGMAGLAVLAGSPLSAQIEFPAASPRAKLTQTIGLTDVAVDYSRPGAKGRNIFGGLVPYGQVWRTGANAATTLTFENDVLLEGNDVRAGTYALYTVPGESEWTVILSTNTELWGATGYDPSSDALRFTVKPRELPLQVETFTIGFEALTDDGALMHLDWERVRVPIQLKTTDDARIRNALETRMPPLEDAGAALLYNAASYYLNHGGDLKQAQVWIDAAAEQRPEAYWVLFEKARIEAARGDKATALDSASAALDKARGAGADAGMIFAIESFISSQS